MPEIGSDELADQIAFRFHHDPVFHARVYIAWQYTAKPEFFSKDFAGLNEVKAAIVTALYVDDLARGVYTP